MADPTILDAPDSGTKVTPIIGVEPGKVDAAFAGLPAAARAYVTAIGFAGKAGEVAAIPDAAGAITAIRCAGSARARSSPTRCRSR